MTWKKCSSAQALEELTGRTPHRRWWVEGLHQTALSQLFPEHCHERTCIPKSVVVYQPLPKLKNANDSDITPALEVGSARPVADCF